MGIEIIDKRSEAFEALSRALRNYKPTPEEAEWLFAKIEYKNYKRRLAEHFACKRPQAGNYPVKSEILRKYWVELEALDGEGKKESTDNSMGNPTKSHCLKWNVFNKADETTWPVVKPPQDRRFLCSKDGYVFIATYIYGAFAIDENQTIDIDAWQAIPSGYK
jgi:hypothetical protein